MPCKYCKALHAQTALRMMLMRETDLSQEEINKQCQELREKMLAKGAKK